MQSTSYGLLKKTSAQLRFYANNHRAKVSAWQADIAALDASDEEQAKEIEALNAKIADTQEKARVNDEMAQEIDTHLSRAVDEGFIGFLLLNEQNQPVSYTRTTPDIVPEGFSTKRIYEGSPVLMNQQVIDILDRLTAATEVPGAIIPQISHEATTLLRDAKKALVSTFTPSRLALTEGRVDNFLDTYIIQGEAPDEQTKDVLRQVIMDFTATIKSSDYVAEPLPATEE